MGQAIVQVDAFAERPFAGNPAAVCVLSGPADAAWMQAVAREMNLSETAFLHPAGGGIFALRWFTPAAEVDLCGHATLAAAHVLWEAGHLDPAAPARFDTRSGRLAARRVGDEIEMDFPAHPVARWEDRPELGEALGVPIGPVGRSRFDALIVLETADALRALAPDVRRLAAVDLRGVIVTSPSDLPGFDFLSRFFAPRVGIDEDPVTGSAHCCLGPYWADRLGRPELRAFQASARGGALRLRVDGGRVGLAGRAVTVLRGELLADPPPDPAA